MTDPRQPALATPPDDVLELRVHGVNNTSPPAMLDLPESSVEMVLGDDLAGFHRPRAGGLLGLRRGDRGWVPPGITREAYSWGGLSRSTPRGGASGNTFGTVVSALGRLGWSLLLPYGLANVAYWTRRLGDDAGTAGGANQPRGVLRRLRRRSEGAGATTVRVFGLGLTVLTVVTASALSMDLVGTQCYRDGTRVCGQLPGLFDMLAPRTQATRLALTSLLPLLLLAGLWSLSAISRARYERVLVDEQTAASPDADVRRPVLATDGFWAGDRMVTGLAKLHLAAGFSVVSCALAWPALFGSGGACTTTRGVADSACWDQVGGQPLTTRVLFPLCIVGALLILLWSVVVLAMRTSDAPDVSHGPSRSPTASFLHRDDPVLAAAVALLLLTEAAVLIGQPTLSPEISLPGVSAAPTIVAVVLLALAAAGMVVRLDGTGPVWAWLIIISTLAVALTNWLLILAGAVALTFGAYVLLSHGGVHGERRWQAWAGTGPGIFMGASLLVAGMLSSLLILGAGDWLNGKNSAGSLVDGRPSQYASVAAGPAGPCGLTCPPPDPVLRAPMPYVYFGTGTLVTLLVLLVLVGVAWYLTRKPPLPPARTATGPPPVAAPLSDAVTRRLERARRTAAVAHRAEKLVAILVLVGMAVSFTALLAAASGSVPWGRNWEQAPLLRRVTDLGTAAVALLALVLLGALVGGAIAGKKRPLGMVWDLVCFLPRAAHPFAPPCYAERAVPELAARVDAWLAQPGVEVDGRVRGGRRVVLSAHSLGAVLAVATLFARRPPREERADAVRLLTYGTQLRAYFGRIFPELLGPAALGNAPARAARLWATDPWAGDAAHSGGPRGALPGTVLDRLTVPTASGPVVLWRSLWRRTDFLGFPAQGYEPTPNDVDRGAEEIDRTGYLVEVMTHSDYPRSAAYEEALVELAFREV